MSAYETFEPSAETLIALRREPDPLKAITQRLRVKEMGPADHIRTKHEVKTWIESGGDATEAQAIIERARVRRAAQQAQDISLKVAERQQRERKVDE